MEDSAGTTVTTTSVVNTSNIDSNTQQLQQNNNNHDDDNGLPIDKVRAMIEACQSANMSLIQQLMAENRMYARQQDESTGISPLMAAAQGGHLQLCQLLLDEGAPWNAIDRQGKCAGNYATDAQKWDVVNLLVDWGTRAELILGASLRAQQKQELKQHRDHEQANNPNSLLQITLESTTTATTTTTTTTTPSNSSTKPDYLQHSLRYNKDETALLDSDNDAVMMQWETPLMKAHAQILMETAIHKRVMNVGFGMGIIDTALQEYNPSLHIIIEAHPDVYRRMLEQKWDQKPNVQLYFGKWQEIVPQLIQQGIELDGIFYDTYGEHAFDMEDFHVLMAQLLSKPQGVYSFFNGLAPDNLFFHGVACQVVKCQLSKLGLDSEFIPCEIQVNEKVWEGIRRKYWHGRDTYYLPRICWNQEFLGRKIKANDEVTEMDMMEADNYNNNNGAKRQRV